MCSLLLGFGGQTAGMLDIQLSCIPIPSLTKQPSSSCGSCGSGAELGLKPTHNLALKLGEGIFNWYQCPESLGPGTQLPWHSQ